MLRSFASRDRAGKLKKPSKRSFRDDAKLKLIEQLNTPLSPPSAEYVMSVSFFVYVVPHTFFQIDGLLLASKRTRDYIWSMLNCFLCDIMAVFLAHFTSHCSRIFAVPTLTQSLQSITAFAQRNRHDCRWQG